MAWFDRQKRWTLIKRKKPYTLQLITNVTRFSEDFLAMMKDIISQELDKLDKKMDTVEYVKLSTFNIDEWMAEHRSSQIEGEVPRRLMLKYHETEFIKKMRNEIHRLMLKMDNKNFEITQRPRYNEINYMQKTYGISKEEWDDLRYRAYNIYIITNCV